MTLTFELSDEQMNLLCEKFHYSPTIIIDGVEKEISKDDFLYNYYSQLMDSDALVHKRITVKQQLDVQVDQVELEETHEPRLPVPTAEEIQEAAQQLNVQTAQTLKP